VAGVGAAAAADETEAGQLRPAQATRTWRDALVGLLRPALAARRPTHGIDLDALADHLYTTFEGGYILCRTFADRSAMRAQLRIYRQLVEALLHVD